MGRGIVGLILTLLTGGRVDYLPDARRPWVVDWDKSRLVGRGQTFWAAWRDHWRRAEERIKHEPS